MIEPTISIKSKLTIKNYDDSIESGAYILNEEKIQTIIDDLNDADFYEYKEFPLQEGTCKNADGTCAGKTYFVIHYTDLVENVIEITGCTTCFHWCRSE